MMGREESQLKGYLVVEITKFDSNVGLDKIIVLICIERKAWGAFLNLLSNHITTS